MSDYSLHIPFGIDDGEMDDTGSARAFALGVEFGGVVTQMKSVECGDLDSMGSQVHTENLGRIRAVASNLRLRFMERWINDDWAEIRVRRL